MNGAAEDACDIDGRTKRSKWAGTHDVGNERVSKPSKFDELIIPDEIHDLLRWSDWVRAYRATAEFFDRRLPAPRERQ